MLRPLLSALEAHRADLALSTSLDSRRLFHGRGRTYPGLEHITVDWFAPVLLVTVFREDQAVPEEQCLQAILTINWPASVGAIAVQRRYLLESPLEIISGVLPEILVAKRQQAQFAISLGAKQNIGFFLDMEPGRQWLESRAAGKRVLNLFAYTCAFSVVAQQAGASSIVNVDMSRAALAQGRDNHRLNQLPLATVKFLGENILKSWSRIRRPGPYDIAIFDPPSYQPGSFVAGKDYPKIIRRIPELMVPGGELLICLNATELSADFIQEVIDVECPQARFVGRLATHPDFPDSDPRQQLKLLHYIYEPDLCT